MKHDEIILNHYSKVAKHDGLHAKSTMDNLFVRESEHKFIKTEVERFCDERFDPIKVLDVGCGNGYLVEQLREWFPSSALFGVDFTPELCELASSRNVEGASFYNADCTQENFFSEKVDIAISERVIINILDRKEQYAAVSNIARTLKKGGIYIMIESFKEPLVELNHARKEMCLSEIEESYQNSYLYERFVEKMEAYGLEEIESAMPRNYLSTHFYVTRVFHNTIRPDGGKIKFSRMAKFFTDALPMGVGNYSPILFRVFKKRL